jgi:hypothetical protein
MYFLLEFTHISSGMAKFNQVEEYTVFLTFQAEIESPLDGRVFNYTFIEGALDLSLDGGTERTPY